MRPDDGNSLWHGLSAAGRLGERSVRGAAGGVTLDDLERRSSLDGRLGELRDRSVLLRVRDQLTAALALIELDGVARRLVLCPPDVPAEHLPAVAAIAQADAMVTDPGADTVVPGVGLAIECTPNPTADAPPRSATSQTEWILLTSGTTGVPKLVSHTLASLTGGFRGSPASAAPIVWSTFYDIRRYGGLQILLRALLGGGSIVLGTLGEPTGAFLERAAAHRVTHLLGTPTHWWLALASPPVRSLDLQYLRLSGEIVDQTILKRLREAFPRARIVHAFASTEAGLAFEVDDELAGFPAHVVGQPGAAVELKIEDGTLRIRSARTAHRYLGDGAEALAGPDGFVDTRDLVERRGERYYFIGRRDGVINVGGQKVHPEEVEAVINSHPLVDRSRVKARKNPITGAIVTAEVVLRDAAEPSAEARGALEREIVALCRATLARYKVPAAVRFVATLEAAPSGKMVRRDA